MTVAEIRGKISGYSETLSERVEDLLTSDVFGNMRYVPFHNLLIPFLCTAQSYRGNRLAIPKNITKVHYSFWPWIKSVGSIPCEPDVVIGLETKNHSAHIIFVEAKLYSELSSEEDERPQPNDQLARELDNLDRLSSADLNWLSKFSIASRSLLFVTEHMGLPREIIKNSLSEFQCKRHKTSDIYWTSWRKLPNILQQKIIDEVNPEHAAILDDMLKLLLRKGLIMFSGVERITGYFDLPNFYHPEKTRYFGPNLLPSTKINYIYRGIKNG